MAVKENKSRSGDLVVPFTAHGDFTLTYRVSVIAIIVDITLDPLSFLVHAS